MRRRKSSDAYIKRWEMRLGDPEGAIAGSRMLDPQDVPEGTSYEVEVHRRSHYSAYWTLINNRDAIAGALGLDRSQVLPQYTPSCDNPRERRRARLTILEAGVWHPDAPTDDGPQVKDGQIAGLCRDHNGTRKVPISMYDQTGTVPTVLLGRDKSGRTLAGWQLATAALASGVMNLLVVDPNGECPAALRQAARIVITGHDYAAQAETIVRALIEGRKADAAAAGLEQLTPQPDTAGWVVLHDDVETVREWAKRWHDNLRNCSANGVWPIAVARSGHMIEWANLDTLAVFHRQTIRVPGHDGVGAPASEQPRALAVADISAQLERFARVPELADVDVETLTDLLGEPVDGRWTIGPEGKHNWNSYDGSGTIVRGGEVPGDELPAIVGMTRTGKSISPRGLADTLDSSGLLGPGPQPQVLWTADLKKLPTELPWLLAQPPTEPATTPAGDGDDAAIYSEMVEGILNPFSTNGWLEKTGPRSWRLPNADDGRVAAVRSTIAELMLTVLAQQGWLRETAPGAWRLPDADENR